jgi:acyl-CoA synthetase (AMP-forming)/AMP-acid ligase II
MGVLPCFHVFGEVCGIAMSTITVSTLIILPRFDVDEFMTTMERIPHVWFFPAVATMLGVIINHPRVKEINLAKDLIIAGGYNIYPQEIDKVLLQHPQIADAMTIGIPDEYRGETVKSFVQLVEGGK